MLVFLAHAGLQHVVPGGFGVTIFFFLSGYLITTLLRIEVQRTGTVSIGHFWLRRLLRIFPPFYIVLLLAAISSGLLIGWDQLSAGGLAAQALHFSNYWMIENGIGGLSLGTDVYWSLAVEEHFYLAFPWLYLLLSRAGLRGGHQAIAFAAICVALLVWRIVLVSSGDHSPDRTYLATDTRVDSILFGCVLAVWNNPYLDASHPNEALWRRVVIPLALATLLFCLAFRDPFFRETFRYSLQGLALMPLFFAAVKFDSWWIFRPLNFRPIAFVGVLSYSLYLVHYAALKSLAILFPQTNRAVIACVGLLLSLALSAAIYRWIEKPCAVLRKRLSSRGSASVVATVTPRSDTSVSTDTLRS